jgi:hypothetical protein
VPFAWTELQVPGGTAAPLGLPGHVSPRWLAVANATSRRDGRVIFPGVHAMAEDLRVHSETEQGSGTSHEFRIERGKPIEVVVRVQRPGRVTGRILDAGGKPAVGYRISCGSVDAARGIYIRDSVPTDRDGRFAFVGVAPGQYQLLSSDEEETSCRSTVFEVTSGATTDVPLELAVR